jgi:hypothetical protein
MPVVLDNADFRPWLNRAAGKSFFGGPEEERVLPSRIGVIGSKRHVAELRPHPPAAPQPRIAAVAAVSR